MDQNIKNIYTAYIEKNNQFKALERELRELKKSIIEYHNGETLICEDNFQSKIIDCVKKTPIEATIEQKFGIKLDDECYKFSPYQRLEVKQLVLG